MTANGSLGLADGELRTLVREALRELLPSLLPATPSATPPGTAPAPLPDTGSRPARDSRPGDAAPEITAPPQRSDMPGPASPAAAAAGDGDVVLLRTDADLDAFVRRLLTLFENPKHRAELRSGKRRFRLAATGPPGSAAAVHRVDKGAVTEAQVRRAAAEGARLVLGRKAVLTPLARDRARALGVDVEKER